MPEYKEKIGDMARRAGVARNTIKGRISLVQECYGRKKSWNDGQERKREYFPWQGNIPAQERAKQNWRIFFLRVL